MAMSSRVTAHFLSHVEYCLVACQDHLKVKPIPEASERFVLGSPSSVGHISAVLSIFGDLVYEAEFKVHRTNTSSLYHSIIKDNYGSPYKLQQIQDCLNYTTKCLETLKSAGNMKGSHDLIKNRSFLYELFACIRDAKDCLTQPPRKTIEEHLANPSRRCFHPPIPRDIVLSLFIRGPSLVFAAYNLVYNSLDKRWEVLNRSSVECMIPRLQKTLVCLDAAMNTLMYLMNKCILF
ncbi:hypothetical protein MN116_006432 [Schistosoma mekongi]|uniref:Uncharacterized protein n=1 Tax=Schistosoma mekongi TaxID=38744 RepID=A0AAE1ZCB7_SCHME|nr:hypothetical protein MN116_006432 [Schistosoma mekongi]